MRTPEEQANFDYLDRTTTAIEEKLTRVGWSNLSPAERVLWAVWWLDADVNNGGLDQYFFNSWADYCRDALHGLTQIGALRTADILARAIAVFPTPPSPNRGVRQTQLEALNAGGTADLEQLTDEFYARPDDVETLLARFGREHLG